MKTDIQFVKYLVRFFLELDRIQTERVEEINTHILCAVTFFFEKVAVNEICGKILQNGAGQGDSMAYSHCMLYN